jgi:hypothetical protein
VANRLDASEDQGSHRSREYGTRADG